MAIFKKSDDNDRTETTAVPRAGQNRPVRSNNVSVIGPTVVFKGELSADEDLIIEGTIEGTITHHNKHLTVGEKGRVRADIHANSVIVLGKVIGDIHGESMVSLAKGAQVKGNICCSRIVMADGARFKGTVDMGESRKVAVVPKEPPKTVSTEKARVVVRQPAKASVY